MNYANIARSDESPDYWAKTSEVSIAIDYLEDWFADTDTDICDEIGEQALKTANNQTAADFIEQYNSDNSFYDFCGYYAVGERFYRDLLAIIEAMPEDSKAYQSFADYCQVRERENNAYYREHDRYAER